MKQSNRQALHASGFSINIDTVNNKGEYSTNSCADKSVVSEKLQLTTSSQCKECPPSSRRLHYDYAKAQKQQLRRHGIDSFATCHARVWSFQRI